ncbi:MAG: hypothetical protein KUL86_10570 [Castellaniella sp.]|nr:hypothetical protein [Castellaniella sp.]
MAHYTAQWFEMPDFRRKKPSFAWVCGNLATFFPPAADPLKSASGGASPGLADADENSFKY